MTRDWPLVAVFVPPGRDQSRFLAECTMECQRRRLHVLTVTYDGPTAARLAVLGEVDRVIVARPGHADMLMPRVEVVSDPPDRPRGGQRRTSRVSRPRWLGPDDDDERPRRLSRPHWRTQPDQ